MHAGSPKTHHLTSLPLSRKNIHPVIILNLLFSMAIKSWIGYEGF